MEYSKQWENCLAIIKENLPGDAYGKWISPIAFEAMDESANTLTLCLPSQFYYEQIEEKDKKLRALLYNALWMTFNRGIKLRYRILTDSTSGATMELTGAAGATTQVSINQRTKKVEEVEASKMDSRLNEEYTFENFIEGEGNKLLRAIGQSIATNPEQTTFNPLFIYGQSGVGKTHLVNAIGVEYKRNFPNANVLYVTAHEFKVQYMTATRENRISDFVYFYQTIDVLIIDDIQEIAGTPGTQNAFFHVFNHLKMNGKKLILTCDQQPADVPSLEDRLITRFKWGLATELQRPDKELCRKILLHKIEHDGLNISDDVVDYISENIIYSIRDLEGVFSSLMAYSFVFGRDIDLAIAKMVMSKATRSQKKTVTVELIMETVCNYYNVGQEDVMGKTRKAGVVLVRQLAMFLASRFTKLTISKIGMYIGGRNHATVLHSIKQIQDRMSTDATFQQQVSELEEDLKH